VAGRLTKLAVRSLDALAALAPGAQGAKAEPAHLSTGRRGEDEAYFYLRRLGYVMVARNWRSPRRRGEIDLVGWDADVLCFVEVKTRTSRGVKPAEAAVDGDKQREICAVARDYLRRFESSASGRRRSASRPLTRAGEDPRPPGHSGAFQPPPFRFDVVSVYYENRGAAQLSLFRNAFGMA
jgi:putative endonuclease